MEEPKECPIVIGMEKNGICALAQRIVMLSPELMDDDVALEAHLGKMVTRMIKETIHEQE